MKIFSNDYLNELTAKAQLSSRKRQHYNIHASYDDPCQRLFNAIEPSSYIRPHRHVSEPRDELFIAVRGAMCLVTFNAQGKLNDVVRFAAGKQAEFFAFGAEVPATTWHTVIALEPGCVLFEVKSGPFSPSHSKDLAPWAPEEGSLAACEYLRRLIKIIAH
jgi:cupin fold WbuC family metalloprotein